MNRETPKKLLYLQKQLPIFQNRMYDTQASAKACPTGDIRLVEDLQTGLIYNDAFLPALMVYDAHYQNEQAVSPLFKSHLESVAEVIERCIGRDSLIEVGCGKGFFLEMLLAKNFDISGFDPTYEGNNPKILKRYFNPELGIRATGLVLRHVLEHVQNPFEFLLQLRAANGGSGKIYIEVPCFEWICSHRAWFDIFYEHVNYFRASDFSRMFGNLIEIGHLFGGQYLFVVADLATLRMPKFEPDDCASFPEDFTQSITTSHPMHGEVALWGGASKGVIFALLKSRAGQSVSIVIDINPAKQGRYLPGTGLRVHSPSEALSLLPIGSAIYVMNSNYLEEIKAMSLNAYTYMEANDE